MRVILDGELHLENEEQPLKREVQIEGGPDEDLEPGQVMISTKEISLVLDRDELARALRAFWRRQ